jgi:DNA-binding response OmpR family regulator
VSLVHPYAGRNNRDVRVLVVEDDPDLRDFLQRGLEAEGYAVMTADDGASGLALAQHADIDCVVLDLMLPRLSGEEVLVRIKARRPSLPVIVLTARDGLNDRVRNLDAGADDFMVKPFSLAELTARIRARLRTPTSNIGTVLVVGRVRLDITTRRANVGDREVNLTTKEYGLAETLMRHPGQVLSQQQLLDRVWGWQFESGASNVVEVCVRSLRRKLGDQVIETVRGAGYRFVG